MQYNLTDFILFRISKETIVLSYLSIIKESFMICKPKACSIHIIFLNATSLYCSLHRASSKGSHNFGLHIFRLLYKMISTVYTKWLFEHIYGDIWH